jgi:hypothetical protein
MLLPFKLGMGGRIGSGEQFTSWIALDDVIGAIHHVLCEDASGAVNAVAPEPAITDFRARWSVPDCRSPLPARSGWRSARCRCLWAERDARRPGVDIDSASEPAPWHLRPEKRKTRYQHSAIRQLGI